jgi:hypothetical protein
VNGEDLRTYAKHLVTPRTRWLAIVAGCVSGIAGSLPFGPLFSVYSSLLIFGAILQRWSPRPGRWLMWLGAFYLTAVVVGFLGPPVLRPPRLIDNNIVIVLTLCLLSLLLVGCCDVALIIDSFRSIDVPAAAAQGFPRAADWIVGVIAICLTAWTGWSTLASFYPQHRYGHWGILLSLVVSVATFDAAIVAHTLKTYRARRLMTE